MHEDSSPSHFKGKDAAHHVAEAQAQGLIDAHEFHGREAPGHISALIDAARDTFTLIPLLLIALPVFPLPQISILLFGWCIWKAGRSGWLAWVRLERLHRVLIEEKWEIENHRPQEREELKALYHAKGFEGKLLEDVLDVLMADGDRLLKVMIEEELGLSLESEEHPLKQALAAFLGAALAGALSLTLFYLLGPLALLAIAALGVVLASLFYAALSKNNWTSAAIWNLGILGLSLGSVYFLGKLVQ